MTEVTAKEMVALINADITFAAEIGDQEFVGYLKEAKAKLLDEIYPTRHEEYAELFGKQLIFFLTNLSGYAIIKIMKRDFWNGIRPLGHVTLLALSLRIFE